MREILKIGELKKNIISLDYYKKEVSGVKNHEFVLYADNILEGMSLLNHMVSSTDDLLSFVGVVYEPIDQPIYVFVDKLKNLYSLKICGSFPSWKLPDDVDDLEAFIDVPDFAIYSIVAKKTIIAGESTETASVGNSQWQREGRKIGSARKKIPFIYQTFYSGKDESLNTVREPTSLQVYNHLLYSIRYQVPSFVIYFDNNFEDGNSTRVREGVSGPDIFIKYIKATLIASVDESFLVVKRDLEKYIYRHMLAYISEGRLKRNNSIEKEPRLIKDFSLISEGLSKVLLNDSEKFISELTEYINNTNSNKNDFVKKYDFTKFNILNKKDWKSYNNKKYVSALMSYLKTQNIKPYSYASKSKTGIVDTKGVLDFLVDKFPQKKQIIAKIFNGYEEAVILPLRIHKKSNGAMVFCPDPESGEIAAFSELLGYDSYGNKIRPIFGYCIVDAPANFDLSTKKETKLYKSIANYVDFLVINDSDIYTKFDGHKNCTEMYMPKNILSINSKGSTEEVAIVSTFIELSTIRADWDLCFIHTHHSSWQQLMVYKNKIIKRIKISRVSSKVDLVMQRDDDLFLLAEGKKRYRDFFASAGEMQKIKSGMRDTDGLINRLFGAIPPKVYSFICMIDAPGVNTDFFLKNSFEEISESINKGHLGQILSNDFVVIAVYSINNKTLFKLFFSLNFNPDLRKYFMGVFENRTV